jgi:hypothetical protein
MLGTVHEDSEVRMVVKFNVFRSTFSSWETMFEEAAAFANSLQADRFINISHSADQREGVVVVWYWGENERVM